MRHVFQKVVLSRLKRCWFYLRWGKQCGQLFWVSVINVPPFEHQRNPASRRAFFGDRWDNQLWQRLEERCRKPVLGVWIQAGHVMSCRRIGGTLPGTPCDAMMARKEFKIKGWAIILLINNKPACLSYFFLFSFASQINLSILSTETLISASTVPSHLDGNGHTPSPAFR